MKTTIIALSAAALIVAAPGALAQTVSGKTPQQDHQVARMHHRIIGGYAPWHAMSAKGSKTSYSGAFGYVPFEPKDNALENSRQAGGGGGGGGGM